MPPIGPKKPEQPRKLIGDPEKIAELQDLQRQTAESIASILPKPRRGIIFATHHFSKPVLYRVEDQAERCQMRAQLQQWSGKYLTTVLEVKEVEIDEDRYKIVSGSDQKFEIGESGAVFPLPNGLEEQIAFQRDILDTVKLVVSGTRAEQAADKL